MKIKNNVFDWILTGLSAAICVASAILLAVRWEKIPEKVASHYSLQGTADGMADKSMLIGLVAMSTVMMVMLQLISHFPKLWNFPIKITDRNVEIVYRLGKYMMEGMMFLIVLMLCSFSMLQAFELAVPFWFWWVSLGLIIGGTLVFTVVITVVGLKNA